MSVIAFKAKAGDAWFDIAFRYDPDIVDLIKTVIPSAYRKYDPGTHVWSAGTSWAKEFALQATNAGHQCVGITVPTGPSPGAPPPGATSGFWNPNAGWHTPPRQHATPGGGGGGATFGAAGARTSSRPPPPMPPKPPSLEENWARTLLRRTPPDLRDKLYKSIAKVLHTDLGGDQRLMQELNNARDEIEKEAG